LHRTYVAVEPFHSFYFYYVDDQVFCYTIKKATMARAETFQLAFFRRLPGEY